MELSSGSMITVRSPRGSWRTPGMMMTRRRRPRLARTNPSTPTQRRFWSWTTTSANLALAEALLQAEGFQVRVAIGLRVDVRGAEDRHAGTDSHGHSAAGSRRLGADAAIESRPRDERDPGDCDYRVRESSGTRRRRSRPASWSSCRSPSARASCRPSFGGTCAAQLSARAYPVFSTALRTASASICAGDRLLEEPVAARRRALPLQTTRSP